MAKLNDKLPGGGTLPAPVAALSSAAVANLTDAQVAEYLGKPGAPPGELAIARNAWATAQFSNEMTAIADDFTANQLPTLAATYPDAVVTITEVGGLRVLHVWLDGLPPAPSLEEP
jgi:hypothetical protein